MLYTIVIILTLIAAILLIGIVLIQKSKGGGLGSTFASSNSILGVRRTNDVVEKATWYLAGAVALLSILSVFCAPSLTKDSGIRSQLPASAAPAATEAPAAEAPAAAAAEEVENIEVQAVEAPAAETQEAL
ncbi:MAG: preprotein translocase subunit SecG [Bacteroides sp.]|nr:preprotein translocase subunit SecG [Bacteroides sp.]MBD5352015.1 preprotein translocase subunit SecG [Bacteroides sp.]